MAESHKFKDLNSLTEVFPDAPWRGAADGTVSIWDEKAGEYVNVNEGDYVVSIGDRYEVSDSKPSNAKAAKAAPAPKAAEEPADESEDRPNAPAITGAEGVATESRE